VPEDRRKLDGWREMTFAEGWSAVRGWPKGFIDSGRRAGRAGEMNPAERKCRLIMRWSMYAAMWAGSPVVPVTTCLRACLSEDFARLEIYRPS